MLISWKVWTKFQQIKKKCIYEIPTHFLINQTEQKKLAHNYRDIKKELKKKRKERLTVCVRDGTEWEKWGLAFMDYGELRIEKLGFKNWSNRL